MNPHLGRILGIALSLCLPALAQESRRIPSNAERGESDRSKAATEPLRSAADSPTFDDLRSSLGDLEQRESKDEKEKREAVVQRNHEETLRIYEDALGKRNGELHNVTRRLAVNKGLEGKYDGLLKTARAGLATTRAQFINRTVSLKRSLEEGKIARDVYDRLCEEDTKRFRNREHELLEDIAFFQGELLSAQRSAKDLSTKKELMALDPFSPAEREPEKEKPPKVVFEQQIKKTLGEVSGYTAPSVVDSIR